MDSLCSFYRLNLTGSGGSLQQINARQRGYERWVTKEMFFVLPGMSREHILFLLA
jgi:hypothetical protein